MTPQLQPQPLSHSTITNLQRPVLRLIALGHSHKEIAAILGIAKSAVFSRIREVSYKFPGVNPIHYPLLAYREGVVTWDELCERIPPFQDCKERKRNRRFIFGGT